MEPEIIRMYSSSPPPLDSVADDEDDDDFGEFGGFSEVNNSGIGFADFDAGNFSKSREDFIPSKHLLPINDYTENSVNNHASLTSIRASEDVTEISSSKKGLSVFDLNTNHETTQFNDAALDNKGSSGAIEKHLNSETHLSSLDNVDLVSRIQDQIVNTCNGEKTHSLESLTNGFSMVDPANPQGLQDTDCMGHLKGFKSVSSHSTDLSLDFSPHSPGDDFGDIATFSSKEPVAADTDPEAHKDLHEEETQGINDNTTFSRLEHEATSSSREAPNNPDSGDTVEMNELDMVNLPMEHDPSEAVSVPPPMAPTPETNISDSMHLPDTKRTAGLTENEEIAHDVSSLTHEKSLDVKELTLDLKKESDYMNTGNISHAFPECDSPFGDFDAATKESPPPLKDSSDSSETHFHAPLGLDMNELDDDFGDFKDLNNHSFPEELAMASDVGEHHTPPPLTEESEFSDFGHFASLEKKEDWGAVQGSDDFAEFSTSGDGGDGGGAQPPEWNAFEDDQEESSSWAAFEDQKTKSQVQSDDWHSFSTDAPSSTNNQVTDTQSDDLNAFHESKTNLVCDDSTFAFQHSVTGRLEKVIQTCFLPPSVADIEENISPLDLLLCTEQQEESSKSKPSFCLPPEVLDIWMKLQDIHNAYGLKYQWGGSHSNKKLLCCLGIDTRNILYTGNKKQPVIVPMYAAGLGMLEPTKEPLKPLSAAEKIASIGQSSHTPPDDISSSDQLQESLPPVQFDWSSSGLTNPLDASGGSTLLNLDFFGPVDDSGFSSTTTLPGVDPELYALTTSKEECSNAGNKVTDAFAKLMSTAETTSTSAKKLRKEENLSKEAAKVIASLPDLSFMHAKVLMFPVSLTPLSSSEDHVD